MLNAKEILYSGNHFDEKPEDKALYNRSHGHTDPGEQKDRKYTWYVDKHEHAFGRAQVNELDGTKKSLCNDFIEAKYPKTTVVDKRLEDYRQATSDMVGRSKFKGSLHPSIDETYTFGFNKNRSQKSDWNVAKLIHGDPEMKSDMHFETDRDLGRSFLYKSKLSTLHPVQRDATRVYGVPSIRDDLKRNGTNSVTDYIVCYYFYLLRYVSFKYVSF